MKRKFTLIVLCLLAVLSFSLFAVGCNKNEETPAAVAGEDTVVSSVKTNPKDTDPTTAIFAAIGKLNGYSTYESESYGTSVAEKGFITYTQKSTGKNIKHGDEFYTESVSNSTFVNVRHEAFTKGDNVAYRLDDGEIKNATAKDYKDVYGVTPAKLLTGHVFNQETVIYARYVSEADGLYTFEIVLEKEKANALLSRQMKNFGNLNGYPTFNSNTTATLVMKSDFTPVSIAYESRYTVSVAVLGSVDCVENNEIKFKNFGEENAIPDTEAFNAAIGSEPSKVTPSKETEVNETEEKIMTALLNADMERGVSLTGNAEVNGFVLPVKMQVAADVNAILAGSAEAANAVKAKITVANALSAIYSDGKVYIDFAGLNYFIEVPEISKENMDAFGALDIKKFIKIADDGEGTYRITLPNYINATIYAALNELGLASDSAYKDFVLALSLYIPRDRIGVIAFELKTDVIDAAFSFVLADEKLVLPDNFDDYNDTEIKFGMSGNVVFDSGMTESFGKPFEIGVDVAVTYDIKQLDPRKALKAEVNVVPDENIKSLISLVPMISHMMPEVSLPGWIGTIGTADSITILYENESLLFVLPATNEDGNKYIAHAAEIDLPEIGEILPEEGMDLSGIIDFITGLKEVDVKDFIPLLQYVFTAEMNGGAISFETADFINQIIQSAWQQIPEAIAGATGDDTATALAMAIGNIYKPFAGLKTTVDMATGETTIDLNVYNIGATNVYIPGNDYEKQTLLSLTLGTADLSDYEFGYDTAAIIKNARAAKPIINRINDVDEIILDENYLSELQAIKTAYEALDKEVQVLIYNAYETSLYGDSVFFFDKYSEKYEELKTAANEFIAKLGAEDTDIESLILDFGDLSEEQAAYAERTAADAMKNFYEKRRAYEAEEVKSLIDDINAIPEANLGELSAKELLERLSMLNSLFVRYSDVDSSVVTNGEALFTTITETAAEYGKKAKAIAEKYVDELKRMNDFCNKTVAEMLAYHKEVTDARAYYLDTPASELDAFAFVTEACPALKGEFCKVTLLTDTYFIGFRTAAVKVAEKAIAEVLKNKDNYSSEELEAICNEIDELCSLTDETVIEGYQELQDILFDLM